MAEDPAAMNHSYLYVTEITPANNKAKYEPPRRACLVAEAGEDHQLAEVITVYFGLDVVYSDDGQEYKEFKDVLFVIANFECHSMRLLKSNMCISPLVIWNAFNAKRPLPMIRFNRPLYCTFMQGMNFFVEGFAKHESQKLVDYIHFMGGSVFQKFQPDRVLIAKNANQASYRIAVNLNKKVYTDRYIEYCWKMRDEPVFDPNSEDVLNKYQLRCFDGLSLYFHGFSKEDMMEFAKQIEKNYGSLAQRIDHATHIIIQDDATETTSREYFERSGAQPDVCYVTIQWFWKSVHLDFSAKEELFQAFKSGRSNRNRRLKSHDSPVIEFQKKSRKSRSKTSLDRSNASSLDNYSNENLDPRQTKVIDKRYQICEEMVQTEENYIRYLEIINKLFREPLEELVANPDKSAILTKQQMMVIFGRITPIIRVHKLILSSIKNFIRSGKVCNYSEIGMAWVRQMPDLKKAYPPFINSYDDARKMLEYCLETIPKFHSFVKVAESDPECYKITLKDMLIKPVQRLPSVVLLLNEIIKRTDKNSKDMPNLKISVESLQEVLDLTNESCRKTEAYQKFLEVVSQFDGLHPTLICSNRQFVSKIEMIVLNDHFFNLQKGTQVAFFLFHDCVMLTKNRSPGLNNSFGSSKQNLSQSFFNTTSRGTLSRNMGTLSRNMSFLKKERKPYKMIELVKFFSFKVIRYDSRNEIILLKIRDNEEGDFLFIGQAAEPYTFQDALDFMKSIRTKGWENCAKEIRIEELTDNMITGMQRDDSDDYYVIQKAISSLSLGTPIRRRSTLRRAVSNVSLGISNGLQKFSSRVHLSFINESSL